MAVIVTDIDGCCLDYINGFAEWVEELYGWTIDPESPCDTYNMASWLIGPNGEQMEDKEFFTLIAEFNDYPRCLNPLKDSQRELAALKAQGNTIIALSSFGGIEATQRFRKDYMDVLFPGIFDDIILLDLGVCKKDALRKLDADYFIEDHKTHAETGAGLGVFTFLIRTSYNEGAQDVCYVESWTEIEAVIRIREGLKQTGLPV